MSICVISPLDSKIKRCKCADCKEWRKDECEALANHRSGTYQRWLTIEKKLKEEKKSEGKQ